jgi:hypothetical protein
MEHLTLTFKIAGLTENGEAFKAVMQKALQERGELSIQELQSFIEHLKPEKAYLTTIDRQLPDSYRNSLISISDDGLSFSM